MSDSSLNAEDLNDSSSASYVIVQEQMRDLLIIQETVIGDVAKANVDTLNASRDIFNTTLQTKEKEIEILQKSIAENFVPREKYEALLERLKEEFVPKTEFVDLQRQFQEECQKNAETQVTLETMAAQLGKSHKTLKSMEEKTKLDKDAYTAEQMELREKLNAEHARKNLLQSQLNEQQMVCKQQQEEITSLSQQVENLQRSQQSQTQKHRQQLRESEVEKQQEAYLQRMMADVGGKCRKKLK